VAQEGRRGGEAGRVPKDMSRRCWTRLPHEFFVVARAIDVGCVEHVDTEVQRVIQSVQGLPPVVGSVGMAKPPCSPDRQPTRPGRECPGGDERAPL
jgi:hypothetical protein